MRLTGRQEKHIAKIIERTCGWMVRWSVDEQIKQKEWASAAAAIALYLKRSDRPPSHKGED